MYILNLTGGVGGAKLSLGLKELLAPKDVSFVVNIGDDFEHLGMSICPDLDSLMYTLSGQSNEKTGWGRKGETWNFLEAFSSLGGEDWFKLGDKDLSVHVMRTVLLREGLNLEQVTKRIVERFGIRNLVAPISNDRVQTKIIAKDRTYDFQKYFVHLRSEPEITSVQYSGSDKASISEGAMNALGHEGLSAVIIAPSNPYLSIDPMLSIAGVRRQLKNLETPVVAVSPIVSGKSVKGPTGKIMAEMGVPVSSLSVARHYKDVISALVIDETDEKEAGAIEKLGIDVVISKTLMKTLDDKKNLADNILEYITGI